MAHSHALQLITYSAKLTIANTHPDHQEQGFAGLAKQIAGARGAATPFVLFISTHSDPDGLLTINIPRTIAAELGYRDMDGIAIPAGVVRPFYLAQPPQSLIASHIAALPLFREALECAACRNRPAGPIPDCLWCSHNQRYPVRSDQSPRNRVSRILHFAAYTLSLSRLAL